MSDDVRGRAVVGSEQSASPVVVTRPQEAIRPRVPSPHNSSPPGRGYPVEALVGTSADNVSAARLLWIGPAHGADVHRRTADPHSPFACGGGSGREKTRE